MKNEATKFFKEYFKVHEQDMEIYEDTIDCMVKFAEKVNNPDVSKMSYGDLGELHRNVFIMFSKIETELDKRNNDILTANPKLFKIERHNQQLDNETDAAGNCFSDADRGL